MRRSGARRPALAAVLALAAAPAPAEPRLEILDGRRVAASAALGADGRWCLVWNHSVSGAEVRDCFRADDARIILERSRQPDYAAGLGETPGRGIARSDGAGGYWIEGIEAPLPAGGLTLRVGAASVGHRLLIDGVERPLPEALAGRRVVIRLVAAD